MACKPCSPTGRRPLVSRTWRLCSRRLRTRNRNSRSCHLAAPCHAILQGILDCTFRQCTVSSAGSGRRSSWRRWPRRRRLRREGRRRPRLVWGQQGLHPHAGLEASPLLRPCTMAVLTLQGAKAGKVVRGAGESDRRVERPAGEKAAVVGRRARSIGSVGVPLAADATPCARNQVVAGSRSQCFPHLS